MKIENKKYDIGVIIGRFQIHELHTEHKKLIEHVLNQHDKVILFLGISQAINTRKNPLDFLSRKVMIEELYGDRISIILPLHNQKSDEVWAQQVDRKIREVLPIGSVLLYGSKDSFIPYYEPHGGFDTCKLEPESMVSASDVREDIKNKVLRSKEFRAGMIYAANSTFPFPYCTIDVAIMNEDETKVLLGRKSYEKKFRFIGGFTDVGDKSLEHTLKRESAEETSLEVADPQYICSRNIDDWRYRGEEDRGIITTFFKAKKIFGGEKPFDDIVELQWFDVSSFNLDNLVEGHIPLFEKLSDNLNN